MFIPGGFSYADWVSEVGTGSPEFIPRSGDPHTPCVMKVVPANEPWSFVPTDDLERLQLKIAQRADDISRETGFDPTNALENWRIAEREVLGERGQE
jgi:hypothetical protein